MSAFFQSFDPRARKTRVENKCGTCRKSTTRRSVTPSLIYPTPPFPNKKKRGVTHLGRLLRPVRDLRLRAFFYLDVVPLRLADVQLTRPPDLDSSFLKHHLAPVREPTDDTGDGEQNCSGKARASGRESGRRKKNKSTHQQSSRRGSPSHDKSILTRLMSAHRAASAPNVEQRQRRTRNKRTVHIRVQPP